MRQPLPPFRLAALALVALAAGCKQDLVCSSDLTACGGACVSLPLDAGNCGACGHTCDPGQTCSANQCRWASVTDCGAPGRACAEGERCVEDRCVADLYVTCFNTSEVREASTALAPVGPPLAVPTAPIGLARIGADLFVASAGYQAAETVDRIRRDPPAVRAEKIWGSNATPDIEFLTAHGGLLYLSHNSLGTLLVLSPAGEPIEEHAFVDAGVANPNPQGIAFDGDLAYVALQARDEVAVLDVSSVGTCAAPGACIHELARIDVSGLASAPARAMPARIAMAGGRAYVTLWNLDDSDPMLWKAPAGSTGRLAAIDLATHALDGTAGPGGLVDLGAGCLDPADVAPGGATLYVTCGFFDYTAYPAVIRGSGVVTVDLSGAAPRVGAVLGAPADAAPGVLAFCQGTGYVADRNTGRVFRLDAAAGAVDGAALCPPDSNGYAYVSAMLCGE